MFECKTCNAYFADKERLNRHREEAGHFYCTGCRNNRLSLDEYKKHRNTCAQPIGRDRNNGDQVVPAGRGGNVAAMGIGGMDVRMLQQALQSVNLGAAAGNGQVAAASSSSSTIVFKMEQKEQNVDAAAAGRPMERPLEVFVLLDTSGSMAGEKIRRAHEGIKELLDELRPFDRVTVLFFDSKVTELGQRRMRPEDAKRALSEQPRCGGSTALFEAIKTAVNDMQDIKKERRPGPRAVIELVILSDGEDTVTPASDLERVGRETRERLAKPGLRDFNCIFLAVGNEAQNTCKTHGFDKIKHVHLESVDNSGDAIKRAFKKVVERIHNTIQQMTLVVHREHRAERR